MNNNLVLDVLIGPIFDHNISPHLDIKDIYKLRLVNPVFNNKINEQYILNHVKDRIVIKLKKKFGNDYNEFIKAMSKDKAVLSGSFILQAILNEQWDYSDIDIYIEYKEGERFEETNLHKFLMKENAGDVDNDAYWDSYRAFNDIHSTRNYYYRNSQISQIQLVRVFTTLKCDACLHNDRHDNSVYDIKICEALGIQDSTELPQNSVWLRRSLCKHKKQTLWDHVNFTGFEACKNMFYFNDNLSPQVRLKEYKQIINKCSVFTVLDMEDFFCRMDKYGKRGFHFKPKYNKLVCLEYLLNKNLNQQSFGVIKKDGNYNTNANSRVNACSRHIRCPVRLLYRHIHHYHERKVIDGKPYHFICISNNNKSFDKLLQCPPTSPKYKNTLEEIKSCKSLDEYAVKRNKLAKIHGKPFVHIYNIDHLKYDIQFGLPMLDMKVIKQTGTEEEGT